MRKRLLSIVLCLALSLSLVPMTGTVAHATSFPPGPTNLTWDNGVISWEAVNPSDVELVDLKLFNVKDETEILDYSRRLLTDYQYKDYSQFLIPGETYICKIYSSYYDAGDYDTYCSQASVSERYTVPGSYTKVNLQNVNFREDGVITWDSYTNAYRADYVSVLYEKTGSGWTEIKKQWVGKSSTSFNWNNYYTFQNGKTYKASLVYQQLDDVQLSDVAWTQEMTYSNEFKIVEQPASVTTHVGETVRFSVSAKGVNTYQWYFYDSLLEEAYNWADDIEDHATYTNINSNTIEITPKDTFLNGRQIYCYMVDKDGISHSTAYATLSVLAATDVHKHTYTKVDRVAGNCKDYGIKEYYICTCGKLFGTKNSEYSEIKDFDTWKSGAGRLKKDDTIHVGGEGYTITQTAHTKSCNGCGLALDSTESHEDLDVNGKCDVCMATMPAAEDCYVVNVWAPEDGFAPNLKKPDGTEYTEFYLAWMHPGDGGQYMSCNPAFESWYRSAMGNEAFEFAKEHYWIHEFVAGKQYYLWVMIPGTTIKPVYYNGVMYSTSYDSSFGMIMANIDNTCIIHSHAGVKVAQTDPTSSTYGVKEYYRCHCGLYYTDAACTNEITNLDAWKAGAGRIEKLPASEVVKVGSTAKDISGNQYVVSKVPTSGYGEVGFAKPASKNITSVTVPDTITINGQKYKVTSINSSAFAGCKKLTKVVIGKNVKKIKTKAFYNCKKLKSIKIKTTKLTAKTVGKKAFSGIHKKAVVKVPKKQYKSYKAILKKRGINGKGQQIKK